MRLLRRIFIHHNLKRQHFLNPKCVFSSTVSNSSSSPSPATTPETDSPEPNRRNQPTTSWSMYGNVVAQQRHSDEEEVEEEKPSENELMLNLKKRCIVRTAKRSTGGKVKTQWVCYNCGYTTGQWWGTCPSCTMVGTMKEFHEAKNADASADNNNKLRNGLSVSEDAMGSWLPQRADQLHPVKLSEVNRGFDMQNWRFPLSGPFGDEVSTVLGGGLVPGSLTLVSGDPGVGKSTLLLQMAALIADGYNGSEDSPVVYISGEESLQQIGHRADRLGIKSDIYLYSSTDIEDILRTAQSLSLRALVVDSIQTVYLKGIIGSAGGLVQVKECTSALMRFAKTTNIPVLLIGHVTKSGDIAGPRVLEHIVDVVLYLEGERHTSYRMLRAVKNRFGSTDELGVFEMSQSGFRAVTNATEMFLTEQDPDSDILVGLAITVIMDGSRTFIIEIQALCLSVSPVPGPTSRLINGIEINRAYLIKCVLIKQAGLHLQAVHLNVVSGLTLTETAGDLAIAAAICSRSETKRGTQTLVESLASSMGLSLGNPLRCLGESISFGRFMSESLGWEKWSAFSHKRYVEEAEKYSKPGSVAAKKGYFEAHYYKDWLSNFLATRPNLKDWLSNFLFIHDLLPDEE